MNRIHLIAAAAALAAAGTAQALTPAQIASARTAGTIKEVRIAGASALRLSVAAYMKEICDTSTMHVYFQGSNAQSTGYRAYSCNLGVQQGNFAAGTPVLVYKRDAGGSGQGVNPIARIEDQTHIKIANDGTCVAEAGNPGPVAGGSPAVANYVCSGTETAGIKSDAGISDVEPRLLQAGVNLPTGTSALSVTELSNLDVGPLVQALFGVVVNTKAYRALQEAQGIIPAGAPLRDVPADQSTWTQADIDSIPSLPENFVRSAFTGQLLGGAPNNTARRGWNLVIPATVDANVVTKTVNICRRTEGSGTQAVSNAYFAANPCLPGSAPYTPLGVPGSSGNVSGTGAATSTVSTAPVVVQEGTSAGQVEFCVGAKINAASDGDGIGYAIGFLGRESNPKRDAGDLGYRYVKLDGRAPQRDVAKAGGYPIVYEATMQWNRSRVPAGSDLDAFLRALRTGFGNPVGLAAVDSDTQQGVMSPPSTYSGPFASATGDAALFGSSVARLAGNSCAALRVVK